MRAEGKYAVGVGLVALLSWAGSLMVPTPARTVLWLTLTVGAALQLPLGWWLVRWVGSRQVVLPWVLGMLARLAGLALVGLVLIPALGGDPEMPLVGLVLFYAATLGVEGLVLWHEHLGTQA